MPVMYSIQPEWCHKIFNVIGYRPDGTPIYEKTVEVRKTIPKRPVPFRGLIYCTKAKQHFTVGSLVYNTDDLYVMPSGELRFGCSIELSVCGEPHDSANFLNGKVIGEFVCDEITQMYVGKIGTEEDGGYICLDTTSEVLRKQSCLTEKQLYDYSNGGRIYGLHLSDVKLYDEPREIESFYHIVDTGNWSRLEKLKRPPQSWCYIVNR